MSHYCVVEFPDNDRELAVVSSTWIRGVGNSMKTYWPSGPTANPRNQAKRHANVKSTWTLHTCAVLKTTGSKNHFILRVCNFILF